MGGGFEKQRKCVVGCGGGGEEGEVWKKEISEKSPAGIDVKWLMGEDEHETNRHKAFANPLKGVSCEDCWENIWED